MQWIKSGTSLRVTWSVLVSQKRQAVIRLTVRTMIRTRRMVKSIRQQMGATGKRSIVLLSLNGSAKLSSTEFGMSVES